MNYKKSEEKNKNNIFPPKAEQNIDSIFSLLFHLLMNFVTNWKNV